jgi:hypothetical protein
MRLTQKAVKNDFLDQPLFVKTLSLTRTNPNAQD